MFFQNMRNLHVWHVGSRSIFIRFCSSEKQCLFTSTYPQDIPQWRGKTHAETARWKKYDPRERSRKLEHRPTRPQRDGSVVVVFAHFFLLCIYNTLCNERGARAMENLGSPGYWNRQLVYESPENNERKKLLLANINHFQVHAHIEPSVSSNRGNATITRMERNTWRLCV